MKFGGKQRNPNLENTKLTKTKSHENFFNKMLNSKLLNTKLGRAIVFTFISAAVLFSPKLLNATELVNQDLKGRKVYVFEDHDGAPFSTDSLNWIFERKNPSTEEWSAIQDTTYTTEIEGITYLCGDITDTVFTPDSSDVYTFVQNAHTGLPAEDISTMHPDARIEGDSIETCTDWVESRTIRWFNAEGGWVSMDTNQTFFQVNRDGSVDHDGDGGIHYISHGSTFDRNYYSDPNVFEMSILGIEDEEQKPEVIDLTVYPNPTNSNLTVNFNKTINGILRIYDNNGHRIDTKILRNRNEITINTEDYSSGLYHMIVTTEDGERFVESFVQLN